MDARALKQQRRLKRLQDRSKQLSSSSNKPVDQAWAKANPIAVYHQEAEQRRRDAVKHGASIKDVVADLLRRAGTIDDLSGLLRQHVKRMTALHASCALGKYMELLAEHPAPAPAAADQEFILATVDSCLVKTAHKLSPVSLVAVLCRYSKLRRWEPAVLSALSNCTAQVTSELPADAVARVVWALGKQRQLANAATTAGAAGASTSAAGSSIKPTPSTGGGSSSSSSKSPPVAKLVQQLVDRAGELLHLGYTGPFRPDFLGDWLQGVELSVRANHRHIKKGQTAPTSNANASTAASIGATGSSSGSQGSGPGSLLQGSGQLSGPQPEQFVRPRKWCVLCWQQWQVDSVLAWLAAVPAVQQQEYDEAAAAMRGTLKRAGFRVEH